MKPFCSLGSVSWRRQPVSPEIPLENSADLRRRRAALSSNIKRCLLFNFDQPGSLTAQPPERIDEAREVQLLEPPCPLKVTS